MKIKITITWFFLDKCYIIYTLNYLYSLSISLILFPFLSVSLSFSYFISIRPLYDNLITLSKIKLRLSKGCGPILGHNCASQLYKLMHSVSE